MNRRLLIQAFVAMLFGRMVYAADAKTKMNAVSIGPWSLEIPASWKSVERKSGIPYVESPDGGKGCYIKAITFPETRQSAEEAAAYLQDGHERGYLRDVQAKWKAMDRSTRQVGAIAYSTLDLFDQSKSYRVLSLVAATRKVALQLTLHDYDCRNYDATAAAFVSILNSVHGPSSDD